MLCEAGEKMAITSANQWSQQQQPQQQMEERRGLSTATSNGKATEKTTPAQDLALKCPRCDSSNTKFCYYNNYSLSQPRHFCKACKRYWTRGGTLRNVPVGGGCRKNKRAKRPSTAADPSPSLPPPPSRPQINISTAPNDIDRLIYGIPTTSSNINIGFPHLNSRLPSSAPTPDKSPASCTTYNQQQPQLNPMVLGFPSEEFQTGYTNPTQIQDGVSSSPLLFQDFPFFGSLTSALTSSSLDQQKLVLGLKEGATANEFQAYLPFQDLQVASKPSSNAGIPREVKTEQESNLFFNKLETDQWQVPCENSYGTFTSNNTTTSSLYWNPDASIYGSSSIAPLI